MALVHGEHSPKHRNKNLFLTKRQIEGIMNWVKALSELAAAYDCTIIVEGQKDLKSLQSLGVRGNFEFVREIIRGLKEGSQDDFNGHAYVILTDFDREGRLLHLDLKTMLTSLGARVIEWPRVRYSELGLPPRIEEAYNFVKRRKRNE